MTFGVAYNLRPYNIVVLGLAPGWIRTEAVMKNSHTPEELSETESPESIGRAVIALAADLDVMKKTGQILLSRDLGREYGFTDIDGRQPPL